MSTVRSNAKSRKKIFYVYGLYRERKQKPFYIGKGHGRRAESHLMESNLRGKSHKSNIIRKDLADGKRIRVKILNEGLTEAQALKLECEWIAYYGREVDGTGCLANLTLGGDGTSGYIPTEQYLRKMRETWGNPQLRAIRSELSKAQWQDPEFRKRLSEIHKKSWATPARKRAASQTMSEVAKKRWQDPELRKAASEVAKKFWEDPDRRKRKSESATEQWKDPKRLKAVSKASRERWKDPTHRKKNAEALKKAWQDPERLKARSEDAKRRWQDPAYRKYMAECRAARRL